MGDLQSLQLSAFGSTLAPSPPLPYSSVRPRVGSFGITLIVIPGGRFP